MRGAHRAAAFAAAILLGRAPLDAFTLEPMSTLLAPSGARSVATFRIKNESSERIAVRLSVLTRSQAPDGKEENSPAGELFVVYPARVLVEPGASSAVKVQWRGPAGLQAERCFRLVAEQVAIDAGAERGSGIRVMFRYIASLYVGDVGFSPELKARASGAENGEGERGFLVEIENGGTRHVVAADLSVDIADREGFAAHLSGDELGHLNDSNYLPGALRRFFIKRDEAVPGKQYDARIAYEGEY